MIITLALCLYKDSDKRFIYNYIHRECLFQCKFEISFTKWTPDSGKAPSENRLAGVHVWNIIWSYIQNKQIFCLFLALTFFF